MGSVGHSWGIRQLDINYNVSMHLNLFTLLTYNEVQFGWEELFCISGQFLLCNLMERVMETLKQM